jgi:hypothetical protein
MSTRLVGTWTRSIGSKRSTIKISGLTPPDDMVENWLFWGIGGFAFGFGERLIAGVVDLGQPVTAHRQPDGRAAQLEEERP